MSGKNIILITIENFHIIVPEFIQNKRILVESYEDMMNIILDMIKEGYVFNFNRDLLRSMMEDLTYMYCPGDDLNKGRVLVQLAPSSDEEDEEDEED